jgi:hypothetical protein
MQDLDYTGSVGTSIVNSLSCSGLVELQCYTGSGISFGVDTNCINNDKVEGGCYYLLNKPYVANLDDDIKLFLEWSTRFRINFAACRGVFSHMFQNNWINGVLYMPSFNKGTNFNIFGQVTNYQYCDDIVVFDDMVVILSVQYHHHQHQQYLVYYLLHQIHHKILDKYYSQQQLWI